MTAAIILHSDAYASLLDALMRAAHDAAALNDPNPFRIALAEAFIYSPDAIAAGSPWPDETN